MKVGVSRPISVFLRIGFKVDDVEETWAYIEKFDLISTQLFSPVKSPGIEVVRQEHVSPLQDKLLVLEDSRFIMVR